LPYNPKSQLSLAGGVPYNVVNGTGLKEQLISMAKVESEISGKVKSVSDYLDGIGEAGNVNAIKMNKLKYAIQNNTFM
jgi:hypothetical protein